MPAGRSNFVLFHRSDVCRDVASLKPDGGEFILEVAYPPSPLQGFIAAIVASTPVE